MQRGAFAHSGGFGAFASQSANGSLSYLAEPPSFAAISDPHVVVALRNILKKDSTTKAKGLEELLALIRQQSTDGKDGVEDALLDIWVSMYPRTSIDNSRRVRELAHTLQFELLKTTRKRMEKLLSGIVAAWLAGLFDRDRAVARAANHGLTSFLNTPEKINAFWKKCHPQILDFAIEAIQETQDSLSDERSTTKEDAEAKYYRVVHTSICLMRGLLQRMSADDLSSQQSRYEDYFAQDGVWNSIVIPDASVRKATSHLLIMCLERDLPYADTSKAKAAFVTGGLKTNQSASALEYITALTKLTERHPSIWKSAKEKKSPMSRLETFIAKGSQGSPPKFWQQVDVLLQAIPDEDFTLETASSLVNALKSGVIHREEPRTNTSWAWKCFIDTAERLLLHLNPSDQLSFASSHLFPLFDQFIFSPLGSTTAIPLGINAMSVFVDAQRALSRGSPELRTAAATEWRSMANKLCADLSAGLPEVSKEFRASQDRIGEETRRWFGLVGEIQKRVAIEGGDFASDTIEPSEKVVRVSIQLLQSRNLKPYGSAISLAYALGTSRSLFAGPLGQTCIDFMNSAIDGDVMTTIKAPAAHSFLSCIRLVRGLPGHSDAGNGVWHMFAKRLLELPSSEDRDGALARLIACEETTESVRAIPQLQDAIVANIATLVASGDKSDELFDSALSWRCISEDYVSILSKRLLHTMKDDHSTQDRGLEAFERLIRAYPSSFSEDAEFHTELVGQLLSLSEGDDAGTSAKVASVRSLLQKQGSSAVPVMQVVQQNLERADQQSLDIDTLIHQAQSALHNRTPSEEILPSTKTYLEALHPFLSRPIHPCRAIMSSTGGSTTLATLPVHHSEKNISRDSRGRSVPLRMALYISSVLEKGVDISGLPVAYAVEILYLQSLVVALLSDDTCGSLRNGLWESFDHKKSNMEESTRLISSTRQVLRDLALNMTIEDGNTQNIMTRLVDLLVEQTGNLTPQGLYSSRILSDIIQTVVDAKGFPSQWEERFLNNDVLKANPRTFLLATAVLDGARDHLRNSKAVSNFCNRLISDVAAASSGERQTHMLLVLITLCGMVYEPGKIPAASNRVVFAVQRITGWFDPDTENSLRPQVASDALRCLGQLMPCIRDVYGSFWEMTLDYCLAGWTDAENQALEKFLPFIHSSLKLVQLLEAMEEPNEDLLDVLSEFSKTKPTALMELLRLDRSVVEEQPMEVVDALICRQVEKLSIRQIPDPEELYGLVASDYKAVQTAGFTMLHLVLPSQQEQKSVEVLLDDTVAKLPDELLSLLLDAPTLEKYTDEMLAEFPPSIRSYLLSWKLIFDAYSTSSYKIRNDFSEHLKSEGQVAPLLNFMFDVLGHSAAHPVKIEQLTMTNDPIREFDIKVADSEPGEKGMQWLLVHIYYLVLKYIPGLFRSWYLDLRSKQTKLAVEPWTAKYFSPIIVDDALSQVQEWTDSAESNSTDEERLTIKISKTAKEVTAGYEIDDAQAAMVMKFPASFPIEGITVTGPRRVAVSEKKWKSWIMITQGVITFANGNIIDGLRVLRRNVTGALKGHTECAICYAVLSPDQHVPNKQCHTCKNLFHKWCLFKWFQTSSQNTCPLCRNPIGYMGADTQQRRRPVT